MKALNFRGLMEENSFLEESSWRKLEALWDCLSILRKGKCGEHAFKVAQLSYLIGKKIGMSARELNILFLSALFHDVGKISIHKDVLSKPSMLNEDEYHHIQGHVQASFYILNQIPGLIFPQIAKNVLAHHEAVNGKGYPFKLTSSHIPIGAKIIAVADVYDAISANRSYNNGGSHDMALWELRERRGKKFDPAIVDCFLFFVAQV